MNLSEIEVGSVVMLNSGGPAMTVRMLFQSGVVDKAACHWFNGGSVQDGDFDIQTLKPVTAQGETTTAL